MKRKIITLFMSVVMLAVLSMATACPIPDNGTRPVRQLLISQLYNGDIAVSWDLVDGAVSYNVYRSYSRLGNRVRVASNLATNSFIDTSPNPNRFANYYWVVALNNLDQTFVTISWNYVDNATEYWLFNTVDYNQIDWTTFDWSNRDNGIHLTIVPAGELLERLYFSTWVDDFSFDTHAVTIVPINATGNVAADNFFSRIGVGAGGGYIPGSGWTNPEGNFGTTPLPRTAPRMIDNWRNRPRNYANRPNGSAYQGYNIISRLDNPQLISFHTEMFGPHMIVFWEKNCVNEIEREVNRIGDAMRTHMNVAQFSRDRYAFYFMPGQYDFEYRASLGIGFYMTISGLGLNPMDTVLNFKDDRPSTMIHSRSGIHAHVALPLWNNVPNGTNATHNFWRKAENFHIIGQLEWSVSQAAPIRRIRVDGPSRFNYREGWASGGFAADMYFNGSVVAGSQQQWYTRSSHFAGTAMATTAWNTFTNASTGSAHANNYNTTGNAAWLNEGMEVMREKPFLFFDVNYNRYRVFVPGIRHYAEGISWSEDDPGVGTILDIDDEFFIVREGDSAATINYHLANGKNIILAPGIFKLEEPIFIGLENAVVLGIGMATIGADRYNLEGAMLISDVAGVTVASLTIDAYYASKYQLRVGEIGSNRDHSHNPTFIFDVFARVGGHYHHAVHTEVSVQINSNNVVGDHFWIWRADHGRGIRWDRNVGTFGLVVSGDNVTMHGLFVEHYQKYQAVWLGEHGRIFFFQCETPYEFPFQVFSHGGTVYGWASVKVANHVNYFTGVGFGIYGVHNHFTTIVENSIEIPHREHVWLRNIMHNEIGSQGSPTGAGTLNIINGVGGRTGHTGQLARIIEFRNGVGSYRHFSTGNTIRHFTTEHTVVPPDGNLDYILQWVMQPCGAGVPAGWDPVWNMRPQGWTDGGGGAWPNARRQRARGFWPQTGGVIQSGWCEVTGAFV